MTLVGSVEGKPAAFATGNRVVHPGVQRFRPAEAAIRNGVRADRPVINFINGAFAQRWHEVTLGCGKQALRVDVPWGEPVLPETVDGSAALDGRCDAITVVHNETSTGVRSPVGEIAALVCSRSIQIRWCLLAQSAAWRATGYRWTSGNSTSTPRRRKGAGAAAGLAFAAVSDRTLARAKDVTGRLVFRLPGAGKYLVKTRRPPAISLLRRRPSTRPHPRRRLGAQVAPPPPGRDDADQALERGLARWPPRLRSLTVT